MRQGVNYHMHVPKIRIHMLGGGGGNRCTLTNVQNWAEKVWQVPVRIFILPILLSFSQHVFTAALPCSHGLKKTRAFARGLLHTRTTEIQAGAFLLSNKEQS